MGKINVLLANADNYFNTEEVQTINAAILRAQAYVSAQFDKFDYVVDVLVARPSYMQGTIPEDGICGRTFSSRLVTIVIDKEQAPVSDDTIYETMCHELSHSLRWEKVSERAKTLFDEMILEGLAVALEEQAVRAAKGSKTQFFLQSMLDTTEVEYDKLAKALNASLFDTTFNYGELFYSGNNTVPRWAGYRLGYFYVRKYLKMTGRTIEQATLDSYEEFHKLIY